MRRNVDGAQKAQLRRGIKDGIILKSERQRSMVKSQLTSGWFCPWEAITSNMVQGVLEGQRKRRCTDQRENGECQWQPSTSIGMKTEEDIHGDAEPTNLTTLCLPSYRLPQIHYLQRHPHLFSVPRKIDLRRLGDGIRSAMRGLM